MTKINHMKMCVSCVRRVTRKILKIVVVSFRISHYRGKKSWKVIFLTATEATANKQNVRVMVDADRALLNSRDPITIVIHVYICEKTYNIFALKKEKIHKTLCGTHKFRSYSQWHSRMLFFLSIHIKSMTSDSIHWDQF